MRSIRTSLILALGLLAAGSAFARDIEDGKLLVYPEKDGKYKVTGVIGDKVTFYGVVGDVHDSKHITGLLLKKGENATAEQKHIVYVTAKQMQMTPYIEIDGKEQPIVEAAPTPPPAPAVPTPPTPPAADAAAPAPAADAPAAQDPNKH